MICEMRGDGAETSGQRPVGTYEHNAALLAAAPALLTEVRRLQAENRRLELDRDNLRVRVDGLLRDLDRDAEYWAQFNSG